MIVIKLHRLFGRIEIEPFAPDAAALFTDAFDGRIAVIFVIFLAVFVGVTSRHDVLPLDRFLPIVGRYPNRGV